MRWLLWFMGRIYALATAFGVPVRISAHVSRSNKHIFQVVDSGGMSGKVCFTVHSGDLDSTRVVIIALSFGEAKFLSRWEGNVAHTQAVRGFYSGDWDLLVSCRQAGLPKDLLPLLEECRILIRYGYILPMPQSDQARP